jgi:hypothetical protein
MSDAPPRPLRLMVHDDTCEGPSGLPGLSLSWRVGGALYRTLGRLDAHRGAGSWAQALDFLISAGAPAPVQEIQYWGHGQWGCLLLAGERLDASALHPDHPLHGRLCALRARLVPGGQALFWFRTCESFGTAQGHAFARAWTSFFQARAAGHTYVIGPWQSGLHLLRPGAEPDWPADEGTDPSRSDRARWSGPGEPRTLTCFHGRIPDGW